MNYKDYFDKFNANDEEIYETFIDNSHAAEFLLENAPRLYCPDSVIEETFAFRTWTLRKHFKKTEDGFVLTEFLPNVPWASTHNTICAPLCHHLNEGRWFKNSAVLLGNSHILGKFLVNSTYKNSALPYGKALSVQTNSFVCTLAEVEKVR